MFKKFLSLEWKSFIRSASFNANLALKICMLLVAIYFTLVLLSVGIIGFYLIKEMNFDPLTMVNKYLVYYLLIDIIIRLFLQKIPVMNIRPLLILPITKQTIINFSLGKTVLSFFNFIHYFLFVPFCIVLLIEGYDVLSVLLWFIAIMCLLYSNNFLNILVSNKDQLFVCFIGIVLALLLLQYYHYFDITAYTALFFDGLYHSKWVVFIPIFTLVALYGITFYFLKDNLRLDAGLANQQKIAKTENLSWLNHYGTLGIFLKNDIKLIKRNKRSKTTILMSVLFLFYGLLFFTGAIEIYQKPIFHLFAGIFISGGFLFTFGQFVPSWDSAYYPLMMTQNIPYRQYLNAKWWLIVIGTLLTTFLASFYLFFGWSVYVVILVGAIYNIGVNSHLVLLSGAYTKTPVDLDSSKGAFGDKKAYNLKTMLLSLPKLLLPMLLYSIGYSLINQYAGLAFVAIIGIIGFLFRNKVFTLIEKVYKTEKYKTLAAYKQKEF